MTGPHITRHAIERAIERIPGITTEEQARAVLTCPCITKAAAWAFRVTVRLATGNRVVIEDNAVITVMPIDNYKRTVRRVGRGRYE